MNVGGGHVGSAPAQQKPQIVWAKDGSYTFPLTIFWKIREKKHKNIPRGFVEVFLSVFLSSFCLPSLCGFEKDQVEMHELQGKGRRVTLSLALVQ